jgi:PIN domain nuclease of toxin-antitoxin system
MRVLLDTQVVLWAGVAPERLGNAQRLIDEAEVRLISAATTWEVVIKSALGKVRLDRPIGEWIQRTLSELAAQSLPITNDHAVAVAELEPIHRDPFDRMLIAQAQHESALLLTADRALEPYGAAVHVIS